MGKREQITSSGSRAVTAVSLLGGVYSLTLSLATLAPGSAAAQAAGERAADTSSSLDEIATIVVTARRMVESIQDVPITINAISADELENRGIRDTLDVIRAVPGVSISRPNSGLLRITIRGIGSDASRPTVGYYMDDVPIGTTQGDVTGAPDPMAFDLERVEVLKGPQGTFYGASAMGGAIKFVSQRPQLDQFDYKLDAEASSTHGGGETYDARAVVNVPLGDMVAGRVGVLYRDNGGFIDRVAGGQTSSGATSFNTIERENANTSQTTMLRGSLLIEPSSTFRILPAVIHQENERDQVDSFWESLPDFQQSNAVAEPNDDTFDLYTLLIEKEFGGVTLSSITGMFDRDQSLTQDFTFFIGALQPPFASQRSPSTSFTEYENTTQELRLSSSGEGPFSWAFGGFYSYDDLGSGQDVFTEGATGLFGLPPVNGVDDIVFTQRSRSITKQHAVFGDLTYNWTDRLATSVGLRYYEYDQSFSRQADGAFNGGPSGSDEAAKSDGTVPRVSVSYELADGHLAYASATQGFRIGGSNSVVPADLCADELAALGRASAPSQYEPDEVWSYELGSKNTFLDSRVVLNAAVFYNDWTKLQQVVDLRPCGFSFTGNVGAAHSQGVELELRARLTRQFDLATGVAYTNSVIDEGAPGVEAQPGDRVLHTPKWTVNVSANYERPLSSGGKLFARADYQWRDRQYASFSAIPGQVEDPYGVTNASVGFAHNRWSLRLFVDNIGNADPRLNTFDAFNITASTLRPRTVGLKLNFQR
jgi:outer membrane receptor protein involved in Fe transport